MSGYVKKYWHVPLLLIISFISHWYIFFDNKILNSGDWLYISQELLKKLIFYGQWNPHSNLGEVISLSYNMFFYWLASFLANISPIFSWDIFTRFFFLIPIVFFTPFFSFLLFKKILKNDLIAFFSACIYSFNTFFLKLQLDWITYAFIWWILPALFLSILDYLETKKNKYLIYNALLVFLGLVFELRITLLVLVFLTFYQVIFLITYCAPIKEKIKNSFYILLSIILGILGHSYWLLPIKFSNSFGEVISSASPTPFVSFYNIMDAFTLHMYSWSHNLVLEPFIRQPIEFRYYLIPIIAILGLGFFNKYHFVIRKDIYVFFLLTLITFIFLGKQELKPFQDLYRWLFYHLPLFNLYRESSKFFILIALPLSFFFGLGLYHIYNSINKYRKSLTVVLCFFILFLSSIYNLQHFVDQKIGGMAKGVEISDDYLNLEKKLSPSSDYYRIFWMPSKPRFGFYSENHPFISAVNLTTILIKLSSSNPTYKELPLYSQLLFLLQQNYSQSLLNNMAVKYVIIPTSASRIKKTSINRAEVVTEIFENYGKREYFIKELDKIKWLKKIDIGTKELVVYENKDYRPHIYQTLQKETITENVPYSKIDYTFINPTEYKVKLRNVTTPLFINFSESFHKDWKMRAGDFTWFKVLTEKNYFIPDNNHFKNDAQLNSFSIDPASICKSYECIKNPDGTYDIDLTLYFRPQSYFYLGLIISGTTLLGCLGYLVWAWIWGRKEDQKDDEFVIKKLTG